MRTVISKSNILNTLEFALFIVLSIISVWFAHGVLDNFFLGKTSFALNEVLVTDHPVVTLRFDSQLNPSDVDIYYATNYDDHLDEESQRWASSHFSCSCSRSFPKNSEPHSLMLVNFFWAKI